MTGLQCVCWLIVMARDSLRDCGHGVTRNEWQWQEMAQVVSHRYLPMQLEQPLVYSWLCKRQGPARTWSLFFSGEVVHIAKGWDWEAWVLVPWFYLST